MSPAAPLVPPAAPLPADVPVTVGRDEARDAAREELSRRLYHEDDPTLVQRAMRWLVEQVAELLARAADAAPGGYTGLVLLVLLLVVAVVAVRLRVGPLARTAEGDTPLFADRTLSADDHRGAAAQHAASGQWAEAVRARLRAVVRDLEQRGLVEPRPGRTADEAAGEAGRALPELAEELRAAARLFDDVWYGGRPATEEAYGRLVELDARVRRARPRAGATA